MSKRSLPTVVSSIPRDLRTFIDRLRDMLTDGSADRLVTAKDLADAGLASVSGSGAIAPPAGTGVTPPAPTGVSVTASLSTIFVEWDAPVYAGHAYAEVWASPTNSIGSAVRTGMAPGGIFVDSMEFDTTRYYWVRFVSVDDTAGAFNAVSGAGATTGQDVDKLVAAMTGPGEPFKVVATQTTLPDGTVVPVGTYTADGFIHNGQITNAKIANLAVDSAKIASVSADKLKAGSIAVGEYIESTGYVAGSAGWRIDGNGNAEFSNATVRGTVYATNGQFYGTLLGGAATGYSSGLGFYAGGGTTSDGANYRWRAGSPSGARIQWTGSAIEVYNSSNQLTLSSGGVSASFVSGLGDFATLDQVTSANISTYIASAAIGNTYISDLNATKITAGTIAAARLDSAVITAKVANLTGAQIGNAEIDTLQLAGQAVTIPVSSYTSGSITISVSSNYEIPHTEVTVASATITSSGAPIFITYTGISKLGSYFTYDGSPGYYSRANHIIKIYRGTTAIRQQTVYIDGPVTIALSETPGAATHTYYVKVTVDTSPGTDALSGGNVSARSLLLLETKR